jgi:hypothetical protein
MFVMYALVQVATIQLHNPFVDIDNEAGPSRVMRIGRGARDRE